MPELEFFTVTSGGVGAIQVDFIDTGTDPDEEKVFAFVNFVPREPPGTVHWLEGLTIPRGIQLDTVQGRFSSEDGKLRTIIGRPKTEQQKVTATGTPITLTYSGQTTASFANTASPAQVQTALENLSNIAVGDVYVSGVMQNERQTVTVGGGATGGTFKLTLDTQTSGPISRNASASTVQALLQAMSNIGSNGCSVTGPIGGPWIVEFTGTLAGANVSQMTGNATLLTPSGSVTVTTTQAGSTGTPWTVNFIGAFDGTDVVQMTATNATVTTTQGGTGDLGVKLVANTPVMDLGVDADGHPIDLVYDVEFVVPDLDPLREDRIISPFGIVAPRTGGTVVDLSDPDLHVPPRAV